VCNGLMVAPLDNEQNGKGKRQRQNFTQSIFLEGAGLPPVGPGAFVEMEAFLHAFTANFYLFLIFSLMRLFTSISKFKGL
jgi:hypothetical protein